MTDKSYLDEIGTDFAKDSSKENDGVWITLGRFEYRIARAHRNNKRFLKQFEEKMRPYQWALDRGNVAALREVANDVLHIVYAESILRGIRRTDTKEELPYTPEDGAMLFKKLPDLWDEVFRTANNAEVYAPEQVKADSGN
jgi:hypothetical protein